LFAWGASRIRFLRIPVRLPGEKRVDKVILRLHEIRPDFTKKWALVHRQRENQIVNVPDRFAKADLEFFISGRFFFRVDASGLKRLSHVLNFIAVLLERM